MYSEPFSYLKPASPSDRYTGDDKKSSGIKHVVISNASHILRKLLQCIDIITPDGGQAARVTLYNHYDAP